MLYNWQRKAAEMMAVRSIGTLHPWQRECLEKWLQNNGRGIVNVATGAGKTILALACADELGKRLKESHGGTAPQGLLKIKIVMPKVFMLSQWRKVILQELPVRRMDIGVCRGGAKDGLSLQIMLYVVNSARYTLAKDILKDLRAGHPVLLICDECHHMGSAENAKCFDFIPLLPETGAPFYSLGLSATPDSPGYQTVLVPSLGGEIYRYGLSEALEDGIVSHYHLVNVALGFTPEEAQEHGELTESLGISLGKLKRKEPYLQALSGQRFFERVQALCEKGGPEVSGLAGTVLALSHKRKEIVYSAKERLECACALLERLAGRRRTIVFGERIDICETLYRRMSVLHPGRAGRYHSQMTPQARERALAEYGLGQTDILISCRAFDEGLDIPDTDAGIVLSSTGSTRQRIQRVGRLLRSYAGGGVKTIYYLYIPESGEETSLLPPDKHKDIWTTELWFDSKTREFCHERYDALCGQLAGTLTEKDLTDGQWDELLKCIRIGSVCGDWRLGAKECRRRVDEAKNAEARNYWIVMWRVAKLEMATRPLQHRHSEL